MGKKNKYKQDEKENQGQQPTAAPPGQQTPAAAGRQAEGAGAATAGTAAQQAPKPGTSGAQRPNQPVASASGGQGWGASSAQGQQFVQRQQHQTAQQPQSRGAPPQRDQQRVQQQSASPAQQQQRGPPQRMPQQSAAPAQQQQRGPPQRMPQQSAAPAQQQWGPPPQQSAPPAQQQWGPPQRMPQQSAPPAQQQQQWGPSQQAARGPQGQNQGQAQGQRRPMPEQQQQQQRQPQATGKQRQPQPTGGQHRPQQQAQGGRPPQGDYQADVQRQFQKLQCDDTSSVTSVASSSSDTNSIKRGTAGQKGNVEANYLRLNLAKMPDTAFHYDVTITPDRPKKFLRPAFDQFNRQFFPNIPMAYDGIKSFYTAQRIDNIENGFEQTVVLDDSGGRTITFKLVIKPTGSLEIDLRSLHNYRRDHIYDKPMRALQCLEVVLASSCHNRGIRGGRSFYNKPEKTIPLGAGYELYTGLYQAMTLGDEPFFNVDISHKSFPKEMPVLDFFRDNRAHRDFSPQQTLAPRARYDLIDFLKGVKIVYTPPRNFGASEKEYIVRDVSEEAAARKMFTLDDGQKLSVAEYFHGRGYGLRFPNLNCLIVGSTVKTISLPIELCSVKGGQALKRKDDPNVVSDMIRHAATSTNLRKEKIMALLRRFDHNSSPIVQSFGIFVGNAFISVPMRLLTPPNIEYLNRQIIKVDNGSWRMFDNTQYLVTKPKQHKWAVIYSRDSRSINFSVLQKGLVENLMRAARGHNLDLNPKPLIDSFVDINSKLTELKRENYDLVIVVIPFRRTTYADIKQAAELKVGILTQCIKETTVERRCDMMLANNLLLKINAKLNGTNHKINANTHIPLPNVMFVGADVTHPSPDQRAIPSVVGVAASHDPHGACYNMQYRLQKSTVENIEDMESIFTQHMHVYKRHNNKFPDHIIYYRDGVSDGQFKIVKQNELRSMRVACQKLGVKAKITCTIVVKRHHTRFFPTQPTRDRKYNNVDPGTVVDKVIVHPNEVQFFMVSHQSIQGTAKPTRYNVIEDDADMNIDDLQRLTHNLCHLFPRCNRAVSYPTPVYLAHLVAFRGRVYIEGPKTYGDLRKEYEKRQINPNFMASNPMYFV